MKVLDLFSGLGGWSSAFRNRGHEVVTVDIDPSFNPTIVANINELELEHLGDGWDIVLASPPCECFSVASISKHWLGGYGSCVPKTERAKSALELVRHTLDLIEGLEPKSWILENPRSKLRKIPFMGKYERATVTFCQYGDERMKPTDLWGVFPPTLEFRPMCKPSDDCHVRAPRGSKTGTQGRKNSASRSLIPYGLSLSVCLAMEEWLRSLEG